jgi:hypothetical protein
MMMRPGIAWLTALVGVVGLAPAVGAQTPAPVQLQPGNTVLIARYECSPGDLGKVDQLIKESAAVTLNKMVAEGKLLTWGVLAAYVGGPANRTIYVWGKDPVSLLQARQVYLPEVMAKPSFAELGRLCPKQVVTLENLLLTPASK